MNDVVRLIDEVNFRRYVICKGSKRHKVIILLKSILRDLIVQIAESLTATFNCSQIVFK